MARPAALQFLKKGMLLAGKVFPQFVATWNWLVRAFDSFCGDGDLNVQQGYITVDRTNADRPVIRLDVQKIMNLMSGKSVSGRFAISEDGLSYTNCYYNVGGRTYSIADTAIPANTDRIDALSINIAGSSPSANIVVYQDLESLQDAQKVQDYYIIPLYTWVGGKISLDWRIGPNAAMGEFV